VDNLGEGFGDEAGATDERAVDAVFGHEVTDVVGFDGTAVEDACSFCGALATATGELIADDAMGFGGDFGCGGGPGADGPDGFVGDDEAACFGRGDIVQSRAKLAADDLFGATVFTLSEGFTDVNDGREAMDDGGLENEVDAVVGLAEVEALLGVAEEYVTAADGHQHGGRDLAGVGTFVEPVHVLRAGADVVVVGGDDGGGERGEGREDQNLVAFMAGDERKKIFDEAYGFDWGFVHLPVAGDDRLAHANSETPMNGFFLMQEVFHRQAVTRVRAKELSALSFEL